MDLTEIRPLDFRRSLDEAEDLSIIQVKRRNNGLIRVSAGMAAGLGTCVVSTFAFLAAINVLIGWLGWAALPFGLLGFAGVLVLSFLAFGRYLEPSERRLLPMLVEPDANDFLEDNWARRDRLLAEADAFNTALQALKALPERAGEDEIDAGVFINLAARRARLEAETKAYLAEFAAATENERRRVAAANAAHRDRRHVSPHRQSLREFRQKVRKLAALERSLDALPGSVAGGPAVDLAPHQVAVRFREELEVERAHLIRCGLSPKKLPKRRIDRKFLPP